MPSATKETLIVFNKVRAIPLKNARTDPSGLPYDYVMSWTKGFKLNVTADTEDLTPLFETFAKGAFKSDNLSYKYKDGDHTVFEVSYKRKGQTQKYAFVVGGSNV